MSDKRKMGGWKKYVWAAVGGALIGAAGQLKRDRELARKAKWDPNIARRGEKVIALEDIPGGGINDSIRQGEIYTVSGYGYGSYNFKECGPTYSPYVGEYCAQSFDAKKFKKIDTQVTETEQEKQ